MLRQQTGSPQVRDPFPALPGTVCEIRLIFAYSLRSAMIEARGADGVRRAINSALEGSGAVCALQVFQALSGDP
jgi:hypothetical protein